MTGGAHQTPVAVLASGIGSNLQALIDAARGYRVACVVSDRPAAPALARARAAGIPAVPIDPAPHAGPATPGFDDALERCLNAHDVELVVLAGFMRILGSDFVRRRRGTILNVHPSLLPKYRGLDTYRRVLDAGDAEHGATVHFVTESLDSGPAILQVVVPVEPGDDESTLAARVQAQEHRVYPFAVGLVAQGRVVLGDRGVELDGRRLAEPIRIDADTDLRCVA